MENGGPAASAASAADASEKADGGHQRTYQACIPCRKRKVRCDLGPPDNPHDPPCKRCRRESKDCYFSATRRKRRPEDSGQTGSDVEDDIEYQHHNGRKRLVTSEDVLSPASPSLGDVPTRPLTPGGSVGRSRPLQRPQNRAKREDDPAVNEHTAAIMQNGEMYSSHDALKLLSEAAGQASDLGHGRVGSASSLRRGTPGAHHANLHFGGSPDGPRHLGSLTSVLDPSLSKSTAPPVESPPGYDDALAVWSRFRFVRAGWFSASEGIDYIDHFYKYMFPLTPVAVPDYRDYRLHHKLLEEEPMLTMTMLMIASRYKELKTKGAESRRFAIHTRLWEQLRVLIDKIFWGQEQFGGGFTGGGAHRIHNISRRGLRTLGSIESLILLTEWHPRALHFPPQDDSEDLLAPEPGMQSDRGTPTPCSNIAYPGRNVSSWLEPCWRSDKICWTLLSNAQSLAIEVGVFDDERPYLEAHELLSEEKHIAEIKRKEKVKELLLIYMVFTSGRLNYVSITPKHYSSPDFLYQHTRQLGERLQTLRAIPGASPETIGQETALYLWMDLAYSFSKGNVDLFSSRKKTRDIIQSNKYVARLEEYNATLRQWKENYDKYSPSIPLYMRHILNVEYEYSRVYLNGLALQAIVDRCTNNTPDYNRMSDEASTGTHRAMPPALLREWIGHDRPYIEQIILGSRSLLRIVSEGLLPNGYLKHTPVRTYFRILSVAMQLLKALAFGSFENELNASLKALHHAMTAIENSIVDDVHVASQMAELLNTLADRVKMRFVRLHGNGPDATSAPRSHDAGQRAGISAGQQSQTPSSFPQTPSAPGFAHSPVTSQPSNSGQYLPAEGSPYEPFSGISLETWDPKNDTTIMPPPNLGWGGPVDFTNGNGTSQAGNFVNTPAQSSDYMNNNSSNDWLALNLNPLLQGPNGTVTQTTYGPEIDGYDMLDVLLGNNIGDGQF